MLVLKRAKMIRIKELPWLLLFGSLWGVSEVFVGGALYNANISRASVCLSIWAVFILAAARGVLNKPGSSTAVGLIAAAYKLLNTAPFFCHIYGILLFALAFDLAFLLLPKNERRFSFRAIAAFMAGVYGGHAFFAVLASYIIRYQYWTEGGLSKVLDHIFINGSLTAIPCFLFFPLGQRIGSCSESFALRHVKWAYGVALLLSLILWTLGQIA